MNVKKSTWLAVNTFKQFICLMQYDRFKFVWDVDFFPPAERTNCSSVTYCATIYPEVSWNSYVKSMLGPSKQTQHVLYVGSQDSRSSRWEMTNCT